MSDSLRHSTFLLLVNEPTRPPYALAVNVFITGLIIINVLAVILQSVPDYNRQYYLWFKMIELISAQIFTAEWILRV